MTGPFASRATRAQLDRMRAVIVPHPRGLDVWFRTSRERWLWTRVPGTVDLYEESERLPALPPGAAP